MRCTQRGADKVEEAVTRCQDDEYHCLRAKTALQDKYWQLCALGGNARELEDLYRKLGGDLEPIWAQRERIRKLLDAVQRGKRNVWRDWLKRQRARSRGKIIRWAQRGKAEEGYAGLRAEPEGEEQTIDPRLEAAATAWGDLRSRGRPHAL